LINLHGLVKNDLLFVGRDREAKYKISATCITNIVDEPHFDTVYLHDIKHLGFENSLPSVCQILATRQVGGSRKRANPSKVKIAVSVLIAENITPFNIRPDAISRTYQPPPTFLLRAHLIL
jgi:hypothetical protein